MRKCYADWVEKLVIKTMGRVITLSRSKYVVDDDTGGFFGIIKHISKYGYSLSTADGEYLVEWRGDRVTLRKDILYAIHHSDVNY
jgi:hypothetical protein